MWEGAQKRSFLEEESASSREGYLRPDLQDMQRLK
jgi:hypothetical protein